MTRPIHSVKHVQSAFNKFQILALIFAVVTIGAVLLASISSIQLARLGSRQKAKSSNDIQSIETAMSKKLSSANQELASLKKKLGDMNAILKSLQSKNANLKKKLAEGLQQHTPKHPSESSVETPEKTIQMERAVPESTPINSPKAKPITEPSETIPPPEEAPQTIPVVPGQPQSQTSGDLPLEAPSPKANEKLADDLLPNDTKTDIEPQSQVANTTPDSGVNAEIPPKVVHPIPQAQ